MRQLLNQLPSMASMVLPGGRQHFLKSNEVFKDKCKTDADKSQEKLCRFIMQVPKNTMGIAAWLN